MSKPIDFTSHPRYTPDLVGLACGKVTATRLQLGLSHAEFAEVLGRLLSWQPAPGLIRSWDRTTAAPPGDVIAACDVLTSPETLLGQVPAQARHLDQPADSNAGGATEPTSIPFNAMANREWNREDAQLPSGSFDATLDRRTFLALTGATAAALGAIGTFDGGIDGRLETCRDKGRVDAETCEGLADVMLSYRQVYRSASPGGLLAPVCGTLELLAELAPGSGRYRDTMVSLIGQAAALVGAILMFDLDDFAAAKQYLAIGAKAARQAADSELMAIVLACQAFRATYSGDPRAGTAFAQGALDVAAIEIHPRSHGWVAAVASEMHATLGPGEKAPCMAALDIAAEQLARPMPEQPWAGIGAFDDGKLAAYRGGDLMRLGDHASAQAQLQAALDQLSPALAKHRCTAHIDLAEAYAYDNEPGHAASHAGSALEIISSTRHADSLRRVENIHTAIGSSGTAEARELGARLLEFKATS